MTHPEGAARRVMVVGAGRRIQNNFLPAIDAMPGLEVAGVWSRTPSHAEAVAQRWGVPVAHRLEDAVGTVDAVVVSVATAGVPAVLARLATAAPTLDLVVDTPVFGQIRHLRSLAALRRFRRVFVAEDYMAFPQWELLRTAVADGLVGPVRSVELAHSGFRYHGLALARSILGFPLARVTRRRRTEDGMAYEFDFGRSGRATIIEPYDQHRGTTVVRGRHATIVAGPARGGPPPADGTPLHRIVPIGTPGRPTGFRLAGRVVSPPALPGLLAADVPDRSAFNAQKTCGLMTVLDGLLAEGPPRYDVRQALYDHLTTAWLRAAPGSFDPFALLGHNHVDLLDGALGSLRAPTSRLAS